MIADKRSKEAILLWLKDKLAHERRDLEGRHNQLLKELQELLASATPNAGDDAAQSIVVSSAHMETAQHGGQNKELAFRPEDSYKSSPSQTRPSDQSGYSEAQRSRATSWTYAMRPYAMAHVQTAAEQAKGDGAPQSGLSSRISMGGGENLSGDGFQRLVSSKGFEYFFTIVIAVNYVAIAFEAQYVGLGIGHDLGYRGYRDANTQLWPGGEIAFLVIDYLFGLAYTIEVALKIVGLRWSFFDVWNGFDALIVVAWYCDLILSAYTSPVDLMLLRLLRMIRLLRLIRLARNIAGFEQLLLMFRALAGSMHMLSWTILFLASTQMGFAIVFNQVFTAYYIDNDAVPTDSRRECFKYFGTFTRSFLSMFELALANWIPIARFFVEDVGEWFVVFSICYKLTFGFSVIAVINGCFIKETFKVVDSDDLLMVLRKNGEDKVHSSKMTLLLEAADVSQNGSLDRHEFKSACATPEIKSWLGAQGLDASDAEALFMLIDDGSGQISIKELVKGVKRLKGPARSLDLILQSRLAAKREQVAVRQNEAILSELQALREDGSTWI